VSWGVVSVVVGVSAVVVGVSGVVVPRYMEGIVVSTNGPWCPGLMGGGVIWSTRNDTTSTATTANPASRPYPLALSRHDLGGGFTPDPRRGAEMGVVPRSGSGSGFATTGSGMVSSQEGSSRIVIVGASKGSLGTSIYYTRN
jgi:hypothetical protein